VNMGGLTAKLSVLERRGACAKDLSAWVEGEDAADASESLLGMARNMSEGYYLDTELGLQVRQSSSPSTCPRGGSLVERVELRHTYFDEGSKRWSHCYRVYFDDMLTNRQAKVLEKSVRMAIEENPPGGILELR